MTNSDDIQVGSTVKITVDVHLLGIITIHAGTEGEVTAINGAMATVRVGGLVGISVDVSLDVLVKVG